MNSPQSNSTAAPLIDFAQLQSACDGDTALMRELMEMYFTQADQIMTGLKKAVEARSVGDVDHYAHKLAGSSLACGLAAIVPPLRQMEIGAKAGHLNDAEASLAEAAASLELLRQAVQDHLRQA
jgi:HPt (histidine-containing phosphotransfer) domain-containing protein